MPTLEDFRIAISEGDLTPLVVAADALEENGDYKTPELFRLYAEIQMGDPCPEKAARYAELNQGYGELTRRAGNALYSNPVGPFYTDLRITQQQLCEDMWTLSREPIRNLTIENCQINNDLAVLLRNYRIGQLANLSLTFNWDRDVYQLNEMLQTMKGYCLKTLTIRGIPDRNRVLQASVACNMTFRRGFKYLYNPRRLGPAEVVLTKGV